MTDDSGPASEEPLIDARSPGERWAESGRAGFERARALVEDGRLDLAALWWMVCVVVITAVEVYAALRASGLGNAPGSTDWWTKASLLANSGGIVLIFGSAIGVFLAAFSNRHPARVALRLAVGAGVWVALSALLGIAVAIHTGDGNFAAFGTSGAEQKILSSIGELCFVGLGVVVAVVATILTDPANAGDAALN
jgi:hypothetical protein